MWVAAWSIVASSQCSTNAQKLWQTCLPEVYECCGSAVSCSSEIGAPRPWLLRSSASSICRTATYVASAFYMLFNFSVAYEALKPCEQGRDQMWTSRWRRHKLNVGLTS